MCGFAGYLNFSNPPAYGSAILEEMGNAIAMRGPDGHGYWLGELNCVGFAHRRLAILDLSDAGHQPMLSPSGRMVIAFNGEIYNHIDLRLRLEQQSRAPNWRGTSDTETLLACIEAWGIEQAVGHAVGMFAFALWNQSNATLTLCRDRMGEKPLYFGWQGNAFLFGSELKALRKHPDFSATIDPHAIGEFLGRSYVPAPSSIYSGIFKLKPGHILTLASKSSETIAPYWSLVQQLDRITTPGDDEALLAEVEATLQEAVAGQMLSDVPLGAFLSGGVDSSLIVAMMQRRATKPIKTFSIGFSERAYDESPYAAAVARCLGTDHTELRVSPTDAMKVIPILPDLYSEPFADVSQIPTFLVSQLARGSVTVSLSGDGGDELFGGYNRYAVAHAHWRKIQSLPVVLRNLIASAAQSVSPHGWDRVGAILSGSGSQRQLGDKIHKTARSLASRSAADFYDALVSSHFPLEHLVNGLMPSQVELFSELPGRLTDVERMMAVDGVTYLPDDVLTKLDRASMGVSLEARAPFLDHRLVELAYRLPLDFKLRHGETKWVLRQLLDRYVPRALIDRPKMGFAVPVGEWLRGPLKSWASDLLSQDRIRRQGILDAGKVGAIWNQHQSGSHNRAPTLWNILMLQSWLDATHG